jgi:hypothetical protein
MIESYFQNAQVSMTKEAYFEMCEALGTEPVDSEIPVELSDFPVEVQEIFSIYYKLKDDWDTMNGIYLGKTYTGLVDILNIYEIDKTDQKYFLEWFAVIDAARSKVLSAIRESKQAKK